MFTPFLLLQISYAEISSFTVHRLSKTGGKAMYSPKIHDDLIPRIYHVAKRAKIPMTRWVNQILERALADQDSSPDSTIAPKHVTNGEISP